MLHDCLNCLNEKSFYEYFLLKVLRDWEEQLPPVSILKEESIHWMFL